MTVQSRQPTWVRDALKERRKQDEKWGAQHRPDGTGMDMDRIRASIARNVCDAMEEDGGTSTWYAILLEEVYEALAESDVDQLRKELVQVIAVCGAWIEDIDAYPDRLPAGLCGNRDDHKPHVHDSESLGKLWCDADPTRRLPYAAERRRKEKEDERSRAQGGQEASA